MQRYDLWREKGKYLFDNSPPGHGRDCYRTFESIALGMVVIVKRQIGMRDMYDGLPVVEVDDLRGITEERLEEWAEWHLSRNLSRVDVGGTSVPYPLTADYWLRKMRLDLRGSERCSGKSHLS